jgi:glycosyltransferase involved in cell wall biosynthesis
MPPNRESIPALFLYYSGHLDAGGGGVQLCTREYFAALERAGFALTPIEIKYDRRFPARVRRKIWPDPYSSWSDLGASVEVVAAHPAASQAKYVFLNQHSLGGLIRPLRGRLAAQAKFVVLSHGLESTDFLHELRPPGGAPGPTTSRRSATLLGWRIIQEARQAQVTDHVFCLAEFETGLEHWVGARNVTVIPRIVEPSPVEWAPSGRRLGFVGTLDHPPNFEGLVLFLREFAKAGHDAKIRVVGGPRSTGNRLAREYANLSYLGPLDDAQLRTEVATWSGFLHPIFCYARGASTKLAIAMGWELPIVTTSMGRRGYVWREGQLLEADDPARFADAAASLLVEQQALAVREQVRRVARSSPNLDEIAALMRRTLALDAPETDTARPIGVSASTMSPDR